MDVSRRDLIKLGTTAAAAGGFLAAQVAQAQTPAGGALAMQPAPVGFNPADPALKFDLVIANGDVLDPSQRLRGKRDIGIKNGQIAAIAPASRPIAPCSASTPAGRLVTPGLVDLHTHSLPAYRHRPSRRRARRHHRDDDRRLRRDAGAYTLGAFTHWARPQTRTRLFAFVHISTIGLAGATRARRDAQHRIRQRRMPAPRPWPRTPTSCSASRCG